MWEVRHRHRRSAAFSPVQVVISDRFGTHQTESGLNTWGAVALLCYKDSLNFVFHPDRRGSAGRTASSISTVVGADLYSSWQRSCFYQQIYFCRKSTTEASICNRAVWARQEVRQRSGIVHPVDFQNKTVSTPKHNKVRYINNKQTNNKTIQLHSYWPTLKVQRSRRNDEITQSERLDDIRQTWRFWNKIWDITLRWGGTKQRRAQWTRGVEGDILLVRLFGWFCEKFSAGERFGKVNLVIIGCKTADSPSTLCVKYQVCSDANMLLLQLNVCHVDSCHCSGF